MNSCIREEKQDSDFAKINFDAFSTIKINFRNFNDTILLTTGFGNFFPNEYIEANPIKLHGEGTKYISLQIRIPQKVDISFNGYFTDSLKNGSESFISKKDLDAICFLVPFDTIEVDVDYSKRYSENTTIRFSGKYANISDYYQNKYKEFNGIDFTYQRGMLCNMAKNLDAFKHSVDSITNIELNFLTNYVKKNELPEWFVDYEISDLKYQSFGIKLSEPIFMKFMNGTSNIVPDIDVPIEYFTFAKELPLNNENAILSVYYFYSVREYFYSYYKQYQIINKQDSNSKRNSFEDYITYTVTNFSPYISDILLANELELLITFNRITDDTYDLLIRAIKDTSLKYYLETLYKNKEPLKKGDAAPSFYLKNEGNDYLALKDFAGNIVYLSFWFTGCKPCIKEFTNENNLVNVFKNEKVKIISICMNSNEDNWKRTIIEHRLKTINLFSNGNWENVLKEKYDISGFPHFVLIDKEGRIIENKCARPNQEIEEVIWNNLNK